MATSIGSLSVDLDLQSAQFIAGIRQATTQVNAMSRSVTSAMNLAKGATTAFIGVLTVDAIGNQIQKAFDYADAIQDIADRTGTTTKFLQEFRYAAQLSGSGVEDADAALEKFSKQLGSAASGNDAMVKRFRDLGVTANDVDTAVLQAADGIAKLPTVQQRASATTDLFGKKAQNLTATMSKGLEGLREMAQEADNLGIVLDSGLIANAGKVNDQMDTMKMIVNAEMASAIIKNADAIQTMSLGVTNLASSLIQFWGQDPAKAMALMGAMAGGAVGARFGVVGAVAGAAAGGVGGALTGRAMKDSAYASNPKWKAAADLEKNAIEKASGMGNTDAADRVWKVAARARATRERLEKGFQDGSINIYPTIPGLKPPGASGELPGIKGKTPKTKTGPTLKTDAELEAAWNQDFWSATNQNLGLRSRMALDPQRRADFDREAEGNETNQRLAEIDRETGTDREIREGKKRYTKAQADQLKVMEEEALKLRGDLIGREELEEIRRRELDVAQGGLSNQMDLANGEAGLARSTSERRAIALRLVDIQTEQERIALQSVVDSAASNDAEKAIAQARLNILDKLKAQAVEKAKRDTASPLEQYLDAIPRTAAELNDQMSAFEADGLGKLEDGLLGVFKGTETVTGALKGMFGTVLDGLAQIAIQQAIIKPIGSLLFGGGDSGGGGLLGGILKSATTAVATKGARANGGMTQPGAYLVGERGPEIAMIGAPANVMTNAALNAASGNTRSSGPVININGPIYADDTPRVRALVAEGVMAAIPMITKQSTDATIKKLNRRTL